MQSTQKSFGKDGFSMAEEDQVEAELEKTPQVCAIKLVQVVQKC